MGNYAGTYLEPSRTSMMEFFLELNIFAKELYIRGVRLGSKYASATVQKMKFSVKDFFGKFFSQPADLVAFTGEILKGKLFF